MIDLHTHTLLSDGQLLPEELLRRYEARGYRALAITDHVGPSNLERVLESLLAFWEGVRDHTDLKVLLGVEITHCPPALIPPLVERARSLGAQIVLVHGETLVEPVQKGTNRAAIEAGVDVLAHPGLIGEEEVRLAAEKGVHLEISARRGHCLANGHVARLALEWGAPLVIGSDAHSPGDILAPGDLIAVARGAGLGEEAVGRIMEEMGEMVARCRR